MIKVEHLCFEYPGTRALDDVSFEIVPGSIVALVGPNGAGKTTLLRCLAALEQPLSGRIHLDGDDISENPRMVHRKLGYLSDFFGLYEELTVAQCLQFHAATHGIADAEISAATARAAERLGLADRMQQKARELSRGLRQRLAIAQAIVHEPKMLLLDEPASGLDPEARHALATLFCQLRDQGMTLLVSSHILTELEEYSTHMLMLRHGHIVTQDSVGRTVDDRSEIQVSLAAAYADLEAVLVACEGVDDVRIVEAGAEFTMAADAASHHAVLKHLIEAGVPVAAFAEKQSDMHKTYLDKVQQQDAQAGQEVAS